jgi:hypothetical protein
LLDVFQLRGGSRSDGNRCCGLVCGQWSNVSRLSLHYSKKTGVFESILPRISVKLKAPQKPVVAQEPYWQR